MTPESGSTGPKRSRELLDDLATRIKRRETSTRSQELLSELAERVTAREVCEDTSVQPLSQSASLIAELKERLHTSEDQ